MNKSAKVVLVSSAKSMEMIAALCGRDNPNARRRPAGVKQAVNPYAFFTSKVR
jgi:hypothetical protein